MSLANCLIKSGKTFTAQERQELIAESRAYPMTGTPEDEISVVQARLDAAKTELTDTEKSVESATLAEQWKDVAGNEANYSAKEIAAMGKAAGASSKDIRETITEMRAAKAERPTESDDAKRERLAQQRLDDAKPPANQMKPPVDVAAAAKKVPGMIGYFIETDSRSTETKMRDMANGRPVGSYIVVANRNGTYEASVTIALEDDNYNVSNAQYASGKNVDQLFARIEALQNEADGSSRPQVDLVGQSNAEIVNAEARQKREEADKKAKQNAPSPDDFMMVGSNRAADVGAAAGQEPLFSRSKNNAAAKRDADYMAAVDAGDMEAAQRIVDQAAVDAGYATSSEFRMSHRAPNREDTNLGRVKESNLVPADYWTHPEWYHSSPEERNSFYAIKSTLDKAKQNPDRGNRSTMFVYRAVPKSLKEDKIRNGDWVTPSLEYAKAEGSQIPGGYRIMTKRAELRNLWWDGNSSAELGYDDGASYAYKNTKNNRKLTDAVTRDRDGNIIPPSKRFNVRDFDVRFSQANQTESEAFKRWSNEAPLITSAQAVTHKFKTGQKIVVEAFHGASRPDRIGSVFQRKRATSGPMAYHTSSPELASSYSTAKSDTSLYNEDTDYVNWFKYKPKGQRSPVSIDRAWSSLTPEQKAIIGERLPDIRTDDEMNVIYEKGGGDIGSYQWELQQTQRNFDRAGNPLKAASETWLTSGALFNREEEFMQVLKLAGFPMADLEYDSPRDAFPGVFKNYIEMQNPLVTSDMPEFTLQALKDAAKKDRSRAQQGGADMWDKNTRTLREWVQTLTDPDNIKQAYVWTSIPDKVTDLFRSIGYDGIVDWSGKSGVSEVHPVYIPFQETQVKSATGNRGTFDAGKKNISYSRSTVDAKPAQSQVAQAVIDAVSNNVNGVILQTFDTPEAASKHFGVAIPDDSRGLFFRGEIGLISSNIGSKREAEFVLWHELLHAGLMETAPRYGAEYQRLMNNLMLRNPSIAKAAGKWRNSFGKETIDRYIGNGLTREQAERRVRLLSIEEALADMAGDNVQLNGWSGFIAKLQALLRSMGFNELANWIEGKTDAEALQLIAKTRDAITGDGAQYLAQVPAFAREESAMNRGADDVNSGATAASQMLDAIDLLDDPYSDYALRVIPNDFTGPIGVGDILPESNKWEDGTDTGEPLRGTSGIRIEQRSLRGVEQAIHRIGSSKTDGPNGFYYGDRVVLIKGESTGAGEDYGESVIRDAEVVGIWRKQDSGKSEIQPNEPTTSQDDIAFSRDLFDPKQTDAQSHYNGTEAVQGMGNGIKNILKATANMARDKRGAALQFLGGRQLADMYSKDVPELPQYNERLQIMQAEQNEGSAIADAVIEDWRLLNRKRPKEAAELASLMHDATLAQTDPDKSDDNPELRKRWVNLPQEAKDIYRDARDAYAMHFDRVKSELINRVERSGLDTSAKQRALNAMREEFTKAMQGVYFPLARFGDYMVIVRDKAGVVQAVSRAETTTQANELRAQLLRAYPEDVVGAVQLSKAFNAERDGVSRGFMKDLVALINEEPDAQIRESQLDAINQLWLSSLPDLSWAKSGIHRKGTPGYSNDAMRAFARNMFHGGYHLAKLKHGDRLADSLTQMQDTIDDKVRADAGYSNVVAQAVVNEMNERHKHVMNPDNTPIANALTGLGFIWHMGLSPASALVNLSQTALVAYPMLSAKFGFAKAAKMLLSVSGDAVKGKNDLLSQLKGAEKEAYDRAVREGLIDVTMAHDLAGVSQGKSGAFNEKQQRVMRVASMMFHEAEKFNRGVTFVSAYRMATQAGVTDPYKVASDLTFDSHFDYSASNRPRIMQGGPARVVFLFKQYGQNMIYTLATNTAKSLKGDREAMKTLGGLLAMHGTFAGALGLPLMTTLLAAASAIGGSEDEPWDAQTALRNYLAETFGKEMGEVLSKGAFRASFIKDAIGADIAGRVGLDSMLIRMPQETLEGKKYYSALLESAFGPVFGIGGNIAGGIATMAQGKTLRGIEEMMPKAIKDPLKAFRYDQEGIQDKSGISIIDETTVSEEVAQFFGFSSARGMEGFEAKGAIKDQETRLTQRRRQLMQRYGREREDGDTTDAQEAIRLWNRANPTMAIRGEDLMRSIRNKAMRQAEAENGVYLTKKRRALAELGEFAGTD